VVDRVNEAALIAELRRAHRAHTVVLYGSRARGDATADSDIDVAVFTDAPTADRDARRWRGTWLDAFVHPTADLHAPPSIEQLKLDGAQVLVDDRGLAGPWLARIHAWIARGPAPLSEADARLRRSWAHKTLARLGRADDEALHRFHLLLVQLLEDDFALRGEWYRGPKQGLHDLRVRRPTTYAAYLDAASLPFASAMPAMARLVELVVGAEDPP
jgi:predicted nucleotidyltransferase